MHLQDSRSPQADVKDIFATGGCIIYVVQDVACGCQVQDVGLEILNWQEAFDSEEERV